MIDTAFFILSAIAIFKGWQKGLIGSLFSFLAFVIGIAAALKLSGTVADYLMEQAPSASKWLPFISFTIVFLITAILVRIAGKFVETSFSAAGAGWLNRIAGSAIYLMLYITVFSIFLFFLIQLKVLDSSVNSSAIYPYIKDLAADALAATQKAMPWIKNTFSELTAFFGQFAKN